MRKQGGCDHDHDHDEESLEAVSGRGEIMDQDGPIWVNDFTENNARAFVKQLEYQSAQGPDCPIIIYIDSKGGEVYALLTMIAAMEQVPNQLVTVALGKAMSAGAILLAHGDIRYASEHAAIMIHEVSAGTVGHIDDLNVQHTNISQLNEKIMKMLAKTCKIKGGAPALKKTLAKARDLYLTADEAVKFGIVDHIGIPSIQRTISIQYSLTSNPRGDHDSTKKVKA